MLMLQVIFETCLKLSSFGVYIIEMRYPALSNIQRLLTNRSDRKEV